MRLFVGLTLPSHIRRSLGSLCSGLPGARWVDEANLHMTIRFIGEVDGPAAEDLSAELAAVRAPGFDLAFDGLGSFASGRRVRAVWAAAEPVPALLHLHHKIEAAVAGAGFEPEHRKFKPHVTLARLNKGSPGRVGEYLESRGGFSAAPFPVRAFTLFRSHLGSAGAQYAEVAEYPLLEPEAA